VFAFDSQHGRIDVKQTPFAGGVLELAGPGLAVRSDQLDWQGEAGTWRADAGGCEIRLNLARGDLAVAIKNTSPQPLRIETLTLRFAAEACRPALVAQEWLEQIDSRQFEVGCTVKQVGLADRFMENPNPPSHWFYLLKRRSTAESILVGSIPPHRGEFLTIRALHDRPDLQGRFGLEIQGELHHSLPPRRVTKLSTLRIRSGQDPLTLLEDFGRLWARSLDRPRKPRLTGWNSWDYFACAVQSQDVYDNQQAARNHFASRLTHFAVDDGYQTRWGDWRPAPSFPEGLDGFCRTIRDAGGVPGVWTAPVQAYALGRLYLDHPDWFLRDSRGDPIVEDYSGGPCVHLDPTHPAAYDWLSTLYAGLYRDGFRYFKIDFTQRLTQLRDPAFHDPSVPCGQVVRRVFQAARDAVGPESYLLACGAPFESITGLVDGSRASCDIHDRWAHVRQLAGDLASRWWLQTGPWNLDPDFLIVRCAETSRSGKLGFKHPVKPPSYRDWWQAGPTWTLAEAKVWALMVYMTAGDLFLSDHLPDLNETGIELIGRILETPLETPARPIDLYDRHDALPAIWLSQCKGRTFLGLINWTEESADFALPLSDLGLDADADLRSFWDDAPIAPRAGQLDITLPPHSCEAIWVQ
jgi:hypothetical protein